MPRKLLNLQPARLAILAVLLLALLAALEANFHLLPPARADLNVVATLAAIKDNTLYESATGAISNGAGEYLFAGTIQTGAIRRAVIAFDIAGSLPAGSTINSVTLELNMSRTVSGNQAVALQRLLADWGEGASNASGEEGMGAPSATGDATWVHTFYDTQLWGTTGGSFTPTASASTLVGGIGSYTWGSTAQMVADVQGWLDSPASNFGWILIGDESALQSAKRFDSAQNSTVANRPVLTIDYTPPGEPTATPTPTQIPSSFFWTYLPWAANP